VKFWGSNSNVGGEELSNITENPSLASWASFPFIQLASSDFNSFFFLGTNRNGKLTGIDSAFVIRELECYQGGNYHF
jgi:hypothetical protein